MTHPSPSDARAHHHGGPAGRRNHPVAPPSREQISDAVFRLITHATLTLRGGNALLTALGMTPLRGDRPVIFRVPATIPTDARRPGRALDEAFTMARRAVHPMTWTRFDGCPEGYGIDPPVCDRHAGEPGTLVVHTDLYLTVTVPAYQPEALVATAYALLATDLHRGPDTPLCLHTDRITHAPRPQHQWEDEEDVPVDVLGWDLDAAARTVTPVPEGDLDDDE